MFQGCKWKLWDSNPVLFNSRVCVLECDGPSFHPLISSASAYSVWGTVQGLEIQRWTGIIPASWGLHSLILLNCRIVWFTLDWFSSLKKKRTKPKCWSGSVKYIWRRKWSAVLMFSYCYWQEKYLLTRLVVRIPGWSRGYGSCVVNRQIKLPLKTMQRSGEAAISYELKKNVLHSGRFVPLLFSNNSFGPPFSYDVRNVHYSVEHFTVTN